jgi:transposase-like zinc-binding protein
MKQNRLELADVFRTHQGDFLARWNSVLSRQHRKALRDIRDCRTAVLGGHLYECDRCGHRVKVFNSCRNRSCPKCQATARAKWLAQREAELLPVPYFHVVFTLPQQIGRLALQNPRRIYSILFQTASETLLTIAADPRHLGASRFHIGSRYSIFQLASFPTAYGTVSCKKPFNTQRLVPAPFNEFYPKCSGPIIPAFHTILPPEHFR